MPYGFFGGQDSSRSLLVLYCSFVDGFDRGFQLPLLYTLKTQFHLDQLAASVAVGISQSPWLAKPFLAIITDSIPFFGYKRKSYIFVSAGINAISLAMIALAASHHFGGIMVPMVLMTIRTFGRAMIDAASQGLLLEDCRDSTDLSISSPRAEQSRTSVLVSRFQAAHRLGQFINSTSSLTALYTTMAVIHVGTMVLAWSTNEEQISGQSASGISLQETIQQKSMEMQRAVHSNPHFVQVLQYAFLALVAPSYDAPMAYYLLDTRRFSVSDLSIVNVVQASGSLLAPILYSHFFQTTKFSTSMTGLTMASVPASLLPLIITTGLSQHWHLNEVAIASVAAFTITLIYDLQMLPANVLIAQLAPKGLEGTSFSLLTVVEGSARIISNVASATLPQAIGAVAPKYKNMSLYVVICTIFNVGPISAVSGIDQEGNTDNALEPTFGNVMIQQAAFKDNASVVSDLSQEEMDDALLSSPAQKQVTIVTDGSNRE